MRIAAFLLIVFFISGNKLVNAQIVKSSDYETIAAKKKGTLTVSKSSGQGAEPHCNLTNISEMNRFV